MRAGPVLAANLRAYLAGAELARQLQAEQPEQRPRPAQRGGPTDCSHRLPTFGR